MLYHSVTYPNTSVPSLLLFSDIAHNYAISLIGNGGVEFPEKSAELADEYGIVMEESKSMEQSR